MNLQHNTILWDWSSVTRSFEKPSQPFLSVIVNYGCGRRPDAAGDVHDPQPITSRPWLLAIDGSGEDQEAALDGWDDGSQFPVASSR